MDLVVLGSSASSPAAHDACSGYLVRQGDTQLLLDCGSGVLGRLVAETTVQDLTAIVISHFHPDHFLDLIPMRYGLRYGYDARAATGDSRPLVLVPPDGSEYLANLGAALRNAPRFFADAYRIVEIDPARETRIGEFTLRFQRTTHDIATWACAVRGSGQLVYTADTRTCPELELFARRADLLLCEATYPADADDPPSDNHLTSHEAGLLARRAEVRRLMLTHFWPGIDRSRFAVEAERAFGAPVILAAPGLRVPVAVAASVNGAVPRGEPVAAAATTNLEV